MIKFAAADFSRTSGNNIDRSFMGCGTGGRFMIRAVAVFAADHGVIAEGVTSEIQSSNDPFVRQFIHALPDGPIAFHYPTTRPYLDSLDGSPG